MGRVLTIAHRAGNDRQLLAQALDGGVHAVEADLRLDGPRLVARHERRLPFLPVFYERWHVRWQPGPQLDLRELLSLLRGRALLLADLKSKPSRSLEVLLAALGATGAAQATLVSTTYWHLLDTLAGREPSLRRYYSVGTRERLEAFWARAEKEPRPGGVSIDQAMLDAGVARRLQQQGIEVLAFHVNEPARARQLIDWGVAGIISGNLELLRGIQQGR